MNQNKFMYEQNMWTNAKMSDIKQLVTGMLLKCMWHIVAGSNFNYFHVIVDSMIRIDAVCNSKSGDSMVVIVWCVIVWYCDGVMCDSVAAQMTRWPGASCNVFSSSLFPGTDCKIKKFLHKRFPRNLKRDGYKKFKFKQQWDQPEKQNKKMSHLWRQIAKRWLLLCTD